MAICAFLGRLVESNHPKAARFINQRFFVRQSRASNKVYADQDGITVLVTAPIQFDISVQRKEVVLRRFVTKAGNSYVFEVQSQNEGGDEECLPD